MASYFTYGGYRKPPAPIYWNSEQGVCRWCGCCIYKKNGEPNFKNWHHKCFTEYSRLFWPIETRKYLFKIRGNKCEICMRPLTLKRKIALDENGKRIPDPTNKFKWLRTERAEHHHIIRLIDYIHTIEDPWAAWRPENLVILCHSCHMEEHKKMRNKSNLFKQMDLF